MLSRRYRPVGGMTFKQYVSLSTAGATAAMRASPEAVGAAGQDQPEHTRHAAAEMGFAEGQWQRGMLVWGARAALDRRLARKLARAAAAQFTPRPMRMFTALATLLMPFPRRPHVDRSDPDLSPIEGITIERYVELVGASVGAGEGLPADPERDRVMTEWGERVIRNPGVQTRYFELVSELLG